LAALRGGAGSHGAQLRSSESRAAEVRCLSGQRMGWSGRFRTLSRARLREHLCQARPGPACIMSRRAASAARRVLAPGSDPSVQGRGQPKFFLHAGHAATGVLFALGREGPQLLLGAAAGPAGKSMVC